MMKRFREIRAVGLLDWLWFVVWLKRNEFSRKLDMSFNGRIPNYHSGQRKRAHKIDMAIEDVNRRDGNE